MEVKPINFPCTSCGQCCRNMKKMRDQVLKTGPSHPVYREMKKFPFKAKSDGSCSKLSPEGLCTVYDKRPDICSMDKTYFNHFRKVPVKAFIEIQAHSCNQQIQEARLPEHFYVKIPTDAGAKH